MRPVSEVYANTAVTGNGFTGFSGQPKVLIVDDEPTICALLCELLEENGYLCTTAHDGKKAWRFISTGKYEFVILDIAIPGVSGLTILKQMQAYNINLPVIVLSGNPEDRMIAEAMHLGASDFIIKPFTLERVLASAKIAKRS